MSSANVAGYGVEPLEEKAQIRVPSFSYSRSKIQAEAAAARLCTRHNLKLIILRPSAVYGPEDWKWSFEMIHRLDRTAWPLVNRGQARFTPVYIGNLTSAVALALDTNHEGTYNLTDDVTVSWLEFCEKIARALGKPARVKSFPFAIAWPLAALAEVYGAAFSRKSGPPLTRYRVIRSSRDFLYSCRLACDELGYRPDRDLDKHIRRTVQWYREVLH
jgi:nucleoside-diphosphate-sugar epimerase